MNFDAQLKQLMMRFKNVTIVITDVLLKCVSSESDDGKPGRMKE